MFGRADLEATEGEGSGIPSGIALLRNFVGVIPRKRRNDHRLPATKPSGLKCSLVRVISFTPTESFPPGERPGWAAGQDTFRGESGGNCRLPRIT